MKKLLALLAIILVSVIGYSQENDAKGAATETAVRIFPNPATNVINILGLKNSARAHIIISDTYGNKVLEHQWAIRNNALNIPIATLRPGVYAITISSPGQRVQTRFYKR
ncbi:MAG: T9SS type A sorting domain-containing protein [Bacteroidota bacterium]